MASAVSIHQRSLLPCSSGSSRRSLAPQQSQFLLGCAGKNKSCRLVSVGAVRGDGQAGNEDEESQPPQRSSNEMNSGMTREALEKLLGQDDSKFTGFDLAMLIRKKYGKSYDVQLIKKEFMGRNLLAMNVMWKYVEQRSFPLTEEEYLLRLDDVVNTLKCWGAVSHVRSSLGRTKERPRIGKAVSIFIDMDETGARSNEWIYK